MKTFFMADPHFDAESFYLKSRRVRPFDMVDWHAMLLDQINTMVGRDDRLVIVGDFARRRPGYWRQQIHCKNAVLILGNHDQETKCRNVFGGNLYTTRLFKILKDKRVFVSHYPHMFWDGSHKGWYHVYGHCHNQRETYLDTIWPQRRSMDVSVDSAYQLFGEWRPFSDEEIYEHLKTRSGHDLIEFYVNFQKKLRASFAIE